MENDQLVSLEKLILKIDEKTDLLGVRLDLIEKEQRRIGVLFENMGDKLEFMLESMIALNKRISELERRMDEKFQEIDYRFDYMIERFDRVDARFGAMEAKFVMK